MGLPNSIAANVVRLEPDVIATRQAGLHRLHAFLPNAGRRYAASRNYDLGTQHRHNVSMLSPWIRHRLISEDEVVSAVLARHAYSSAEKFIQEVLWRTYWKGWLELRPSVWDDYRTNVRDLLATFETDPELADGWQRATAGRTGINCFDAWAHELIETGYLHNHTRMWFASIWIFTLRLPWALGADFFLRHLLDGDAASNTLSWRWVAGLQTRGKTYLARSPNIAKYTDNRFPNVSGLASRAVPVDGPPPPAPISLPEADKAGTGSDWALLVHEDDCHLDGIALPANPPVAVAGAIATARRSPLGAGEAARRFATGAVTNAATCAADRYGIRASILDADQNPIAVIDWARALGVKRIVTPYAPVGPIRETLDAMATQLRGDDIALVRPRRDWDSHLWPFATRGFFAFKEKIPNALRHLGVA